MENFDISSDTIMNFVMTYGPKLLSAIVVLVVGLWIVKFIVGLPNRVFLVWILDVC